MGNKVRVHLFIYGRVQGVFYRMSARMRANSLGVVGWVRNLEEGNVEVMAEGDKKKIDEFLKWCKKGPPFANVEKVEVDELKEIEGFSDFSITDR